jgi:hypothetical protein
MWIVFSLLSRVELDIAKGDFKLSNSWELIWGKKSGDKKPPYFSQKKGVFSACFMDQPFGLGVASLETRIYG